MLSRRELLSGSAALALSAGLPPLAEARAPLTGKQVPGIFRQTVGDFEVTALLDGDIPLAPEMFPGGAPDDQKALALRSYLPFPVRSPVNAYLVNTGSKLYLVDTGTGSFGTSFPGAELGHLGEALAAAGVTRDDIDTILLTHLHPDHFGGLLKDDQVLFPRAEIVVPQPDMEFWLSAEVREKVPENFRFLFDMAKKTMTPYKSQIRTIIGGSMAPGINAVAMPGHTVGHMSYMIENGPDSLLIWGDIVHNAALQFPHPEWTTAADTDTGVALETRWKAFQWAATDGFMVAGMHLPFPGIGHVERDSNTYRYHPVPWTPKY